MAPKLCVLSMKLSRRSKLGPFGNLQHYPRNAYDRPRRVLTAEKESKAVQISLIPGASRVFAFEGQAHTSMKFAQIGKRELPIL